MPSRKTLLWINRLVWTLLVGAVISLGSIVSLGRYFIPSIESHQQQIVAEINRRTGLQITVGHLSGSWKRLSPYFIIDDLRLHDPRDPARAVVQIAHAEIQLGLFRSVASGTVAISRLRGNGVHIELEEAELGRWRLAGFGGEGKMRLDRAVDFLAAIYRAELNNSTIDLRFFGGGDAHLIGKTLSLQRAGDFRRLNLDVKFSSEVNDDSEPLHIVFETQGDPRLADDFLEHDPFSIAAYGEFKDVDLTPVLPAAKAFGVNFEHGRVDGTAWFVWRAGGSMELRGNMEIPQFDLIGVTQLDLEPIKNIKTQFLIRDQNGKRQFWLPELSGHWHGVALKFPRLSATLESSKPQRALIAMPELLLQPILEAALADNNLSPRLRDVLSTLSPQGALHNLNIDLPLRADQRDTWQLRAQLHNISLQPWQGAPGVSNVSGYIDSGLRAGHIDLLSENFSMAFPRVYHEPLHFDSVRGQVNWRLESDRALIDSGPLATQSDAGMATAQVSLDLPFERGTTPLMTLQVGLQNSAAQYRDRFIPYTLQPSLLQWLQRSIGKGDLPIGGFIYRGSLLAHDHLNNTVQLFLHANNAELTYQPEWPPLRDIRAGVWVDDALVRVDVKRARLYQRIALRDGEVNLRHEGDVNWLTVDTRADVDNDDVLRLLRETPIRKQIGAAFDHWRWHGSTQSQVHIGVAISGSRPQEIHIESHLDGGVLEMLDQNIVLDDVRGDLIYRSASPNSSVLTGSSAVTDRVIEHAASVDGNASINGNATANGDEAANKHDSGLYAEALKAKWFGKPVAINVTTARDGAISVGARGQIAMADLKQWLQQPLFDFTSGEMPFTSTLRIDNGSTAVQVESNLQGAAIDLPPPYRKPAEQSLPLTLSMELNAEPNLTAALSDWADLRLRWDRNETGNMQLDAGVIRLGQQGKTALHSGQLIVTGAVESTDLSSWHDAIRMQPSSTSEETDAAQSNRLAVHIRDVHFGSAQIAGQTLNNLMLSGRRESAAWNVQMRAEQIAGVLTLPNDSSQPWHAQLNYLRLPAAVSASDAAAANAQEDAEDNGSLIADADPRNVSAIDIHIDHLWRGDEDLGWIETQIRPIENGMRLENLKGRLRDVRIEPGAQQPAYLSWVREGDSNSSEFVGRLAVDNIEQALQRWRYEPVLTSKRGHVDVDLQWPGRPDQFKFVRAEGDAAMRFDDGQFTRASNSATGALKVVGIFNFANFLRRLQFDFSDVYKGGLSFDEMQGVFKTQQGVLTLAEPVEIKSPSSRFRLTGKIDFNTDQTDMELVATLPVASNLPWVAALTGALPAAAGLYVASKVFEDQFDKFSSATYAVSGPWSDPQVKLRRVFDDQLPKKDASSQDNDAKNREPKAETKVPDSEKAAVEP